MSQYVDPLNLLTEDARKLVDKMLMRGEPVLELGNHEYRFICESDIDYTTRMLCDEQNLQVTWACEVDWIEYRFLCPRE